MNFMWPSWKNPLHGSNYQSGEHYYCFACAIRIVLRSPWVLLIRLSLDQSHATLRFRSGVVGLVLASCIATHFSVSYMNDTQSCCLKVADSIKQSFALSNSTSHKWSVKKLWEGGNSKFHNSEAFASGEGKSNVKLAKTPSLASPSKFFPFNFVEHYFPVPSATAAMVASPISGRVVRFPYKERCPVQVRSLRCNITM